MSKAFQCDRCKKFYPKVAEAKVFEIVYIREKATTRTKPEELLSPVDLCPRCYAKLEDFVYNRSTKKKASGSFITLGATVGEQILDGFKFE